MTRAQAAQKWFYDSNHCIVQFSSGDQVLLSTKNLHLPGSKKLQQQWVGSFHIIHRVGNIAYTLDLRSQIQVMHLIFHISLLQPYSAGGATLVPTDSIVTAGAEEEYEGESILRHRWRGWAMEYLVHQHGYDEKEDSWIQGARYHPCSADSIIVLACSQDSLRLYIRWDLTCHWTLLALCYDIRLGTIAELYRTYKTVYIGFAIICFGVLCSQGGAPLGFSPCVSYHGF